MSVGKRDGHTLGLSRLSKDLTLGQIGVKRGESLGDEAWEEPADNVFWGKMLARARLAQAAARLRDDDDQWRWVNPYDAEL